MDDIVEDFIDQVKGVDSLAQLENVFTQSLKQLGFDRYGFVLQDRGQDKPFIMSNYPAEWLKQYIENQYYTIDPIVVNGMKQTQPFVWHELLARLEFTPDQQKFLDNADGMGIRAGAGFANPHGHAQQSLTSILSYESPEEVDLILEENRDELHILSLYFHTIADKLRRKEGLDPAPELTDREKECLLWSAHGKSSWEIGEILGVSERTVSFHMDNAKAKLGASTRTQAAVRAILFGIINP